MKKKNMGEMIDFLVRAAKSNHHKMAKKAYINEVIKDTGKSSEEATRIVNSNIGYCSGYFNDTETINLLKNKYECRHPILG